MSGWRRVGVARARLAGLTLTLVAACAATDPVGVPDRPVAAVSGPVGFDITHQSVELDPFAEGGGLSGRQTLVFVVTASGDRLQFDSGGLRIEQAALDGIAIQVEESPAEGPQVTGIGWLLPQSLASGTRHELTVTYVVPAPRGVQRSQTLSYSGYFACDWMLCQQSDFSDRFTMDLTLVVPKGMQTLGPGTRADLVTEGAGRDRHLWRSSEPFPAYVHAFAAGRLQATDLPGYCAPKLRVWAPDGTTELEPVFAATCDMLRFFEERAGVAFPADGYDQLFVPDRNEAQEAVSHSILGGSSVLAAREDPTEDWAVAHELAHQWWGNRITARDLSQFWLNEALVTFMVAAWKEHRWGRDAYGREIDLARTRWQGCHDRWQDVPVTFAGPWPSLGMRRCFQYSKGAVFLAELRQQMGDEAFWAGIRTYTRDNLGRAVTSQDFQRAMQAQASADLSPLFQTWVYGEG